MKSLSDFKTEAEYAAYLRTAFTMAAMQGLCANPNTVSNNYTFADIADLSKRYADACLSALSSSESKEVGNE